jgi:hypothetical protein
MMNEITINGTKHPIHFGWLALENISAFAGHNSPDTTANAMDKLASDMRFNRVVLFEGIAGGYRKIGERCPFADSEALAEEVSNFTEITPAIEIYIKAQAAFYQIEEDTPKKKATANP